MRKTMIFLTIVLLAGTAWAPPTRVISRQEFLLALRLQESGDATNPPDGDDGRAIGPYQIHREYFEDAAVPNLAYEDCRLQGIGEIVIGAYMRRYCPEAWERGDWETVARIHNGGPRGAQKSSTLKYWRDVRPLL